MRQNIGLEEALSTVLSQIAPLPAAVVPVHAACGLVPAADVVARVACPSVTSTLKDGFAVLSRDIAGATAESPVCLRVCGSAAAGAPVVPSVSPGTAVRVLTGAGLPAGADAVLANEFARLTGDHVWCLADAEPGRNVQRRGSEVAEGAVVAPAGRPLRPAGIGLLAAGGHAELRVHPRPRVAVLATGDEVVAPGQPLGAGQLYASNAVTLLGWLARFGFPGSFSVVSDHPERLREALAAAAGSADAVLTSGGAFTSERDHLPRVVAELGAQVFFHRVRLGPGKAIVFAKLGDVPIFCLAGGPASNEMGFLQLALPGLLRLSGRDPRPFPETRAVLTEAIGGAADWTQCVQARLFSRAGRLHAQPLRGGSRLRALADAESILHVPEGLARIEAGAEARTQRLFAGEAEAEAGPADALADGCRALPAVYSVVGATGAGRTTLIERLIPLLVGHGLRVGTVKHDVHGFELDHPGKDSYRHKHAGASVSLISSPRAVGLVQDVSADTPLGELVRRHCPDVDVVLAEGYTREDWPKIEVHRAALGRPLVTGPEIGLVAVVSDGPLGAPVPVFDWQALEALVDFMLGSRDQNAART